MINPHCTHRPKINEPYGLLSSVDCSITRSNHIDANILPMKKDEMVRSLQQLFVPALRKRGFKGSLPHFRRPMKERIDLLTIQFNKWGGGFVIEVSNCSPEGIETPWNEHIPPSRVRAWDVIPPKRRRLGSPKPGEDGHWFRFDGWSGTDRAARKAISYLREADEWWETAPPWCRVNERYGLSTTVIMRGLALKILEDRRRHRSGLDRTAAEPEQWMAAKAEGSI